MVIVGRRRWPHIVAALVLSVWVSPVRAVDVGSLNVSGGIETQNYLRHGHADELQFTQNRNTVRLRGEWRWFEDGKLFGALPAPFLESSNLTLLYRGVYDGYYDIKPGGLVHGQTRFDDQVGGSISSLTRQQRDGVKYDNDLREAYIDARLKQLPVNLRIGRQQVVWGQADQFRITDVWNPLDLTWHFHQESWDNLRIPLWVAKMQVDFGEMGSWSDLFSEIVYNPFDFQPGYKVAFLPRPWGIPLPDPLRAGQVQNARGVAVSPNFDLEGTSYRHGNFDKTPKEASEVGVRLHGTHTSGLDVALSYFVGHGRAIGAAFPFGIRVDSIDLPDNPFAPSHPPTGQYQRDINDPSSVVNVLPINVRAQVVHPYVHIFGLTAAYLEESTGTSIRVESGYELGAPFQTLDPATRVGVTIKGKKVGADGKGLGQAPTGYTRRDVWSSMIGFDRPTWIRFLNDKATWFITAQFFLHYTTGGHIDQLVGLSGAGEAPYYGPVGRWVSGPYAGRVERQQDATYADGNGDQIHRWEHLMTIAATSDYVSGKVKPLIATAFDPLNLNQTVLLQLDYVWGDHFVTSLYQKWYTDFGARVPSDDPWFAAGRLHRRDETGVRVAYQF